MKHKFINKKTGAEARVIAMHLDSDGVMQVDGYDTVEDLMGDYAAYEEYNPPKKPLIKNEKIRKAVKAWAEANDYGKDEEYQYEDFSTGWKSWSLEHHQNGDDNEIHFNGGIDFRKMNHQGYYTIDELCGEEEENV